MTHPIDTIISNYNNKGLTLTPEQQARFDTMKDLFDEGSLDLGTVILDTLDIIGEQNRDCVPLSMINQSVKELAPSKPDVEPITIKNGRITTSVEAAENVQNVKTIEELKHGDVFKLTMDAMTNMQSKEPVQNETQNNAQAQENVRVEEVVPGVVEPVNVQKEQKEMVQEMTVEPVLEDEHQLRVEEAAAEVIEQLAAAEEEHTFTVIVPTIELNTVSAVKDESYKMVPEKFISDLVYELTLARNMVTKLGEWIGTKASVKDEPSVQLAYSRVVQRLTDTTYTKEALERANKKVEQLDKQLVDMSADLKRAYQEVETVKSDSAIALKKRSIANTGLYIVQFDYNGKPAFVSGTDKTLQVTMYLSKAHFYDLQGACDVLDYVIKNGEQFNIPETMLTTFKVRAVGLQDV